MVNGINRNARKVSQKRAVCYAKECNMILMLWWLINYTCESFLSSLLSWDSQDSISSVITRTTPLNRLACIRGSQEWREYMWILWWMDGSQRWNRVTCNNVVWSGIQFRFTREKEKLANTWDTLTVQVARYFTSHNRWGKRTWRIRSQRYEHDFIYLPHSQALSWSELDNIMWHLTPTL